MDSFCWSKSLLDLRGNFNLDSIFSKEMDVCVYIWGQHLQFIFFHVGLKISQIIN